MSAIKKLNYSFYKRPDTVQIAKELIGKILVTHFSGITTSGRIVETEAYAGENDRASHAFGGRNTPRTSAMYLKGGTTYVYLCYGIHHLFNVVTNQKGIPHAILIRALEPLTGIDTMLKRTGRVQADAQLTKGPGNLSRALGLFTDHSAVSLLGNEIFILDDGVMIREEDILTTPRIGVGFAGDDALLPYRFSLKGSRYVSGKKSSLG